MCTEGRVYVCVCAGRTNEACNLQQGLRWMRSWGEGYSVNLCQIQTSVTCINRVFFFKRVDSVFYVHWFILVRKIIKTWHEISSVSLSAVFHIMQCGNCTRLLSILRSVIKKITFYILSYILLKKAREWNADGQAVRRHNAALLIMRTKETERGQTLPTGGLFYRPSNRQVGMGKSGGENVHG